MQSINASVHSPQASAALQRKPAAPPVYRPQASAALRCKPAAPPVYRPQASTALQRKPTAPPVYRPQASTALQCKPVAPHAGLSIQVIQRKWVKVEGTDNDFYWAGPRRFNPKQDPPCPGYRVERPFEIDPRAGEKPRKGGGFYKPGGTSRTVEIGGASFVQKGDPLDASSSTDTSSYFGGSVLIHHQGPDIEPQAHGAPLPLPSNANAPAYAPHQHSAWLQQDEQQPTPRRSEHVIMGGSARDAGRRSGLELGSGAAWAHTQPDHAMPSDREDPGNRHFSTEAANMRHSAIEAGFRRHIEEYGPMPVGRQLRDELAPGSQMYGTMAFQAAIPVADEFRVLEDEESYLSSVAGRGGDAAAIATFLEIEQFKMDAISAGVNPYTGESIDNSMNVDDQDIYL